MASDLFPKVSCVMVTADRGALCQRAIWCYQQQTYPHKELVVLDNGAVSMEPYLEVLSPDEVRYAKVERSPDLVLGDLRNHALSLATGEYVIPQWDDDDWYHPERIARQVHVLQQGCDACTLSGTLVHVDLEPYFDRPYIGILPKGVPPTIMHRRDESIRYPSLRREEDSHYITSWRRRNYVQLSAASSYLYIRTFHGANTWEVEHFLRRIHNTPLDSVRFAWYKYIRRNLFAHPRFRLTEEMGEAFQSFLVDSRRFDIFEG